MRTLFAAALVALSTCAVGQTGFGTAQIWDLNIHHSTTSVVTFQLNKFENVFGKRDFNLNLEAIGTVEGDKSLGTALVYDSKCRFRYKRLDLKFDVSVGGWWNYGLSGGKMNAGPYFAFGWSI